MKTLVIHNDLKKRLKVAASNGSVVANDVLKAVADGVQTDANANYFTSVRKRSITEDGVTAYQIKITCCNKDVENPNFPDLGREDAQWLKHNRCELSALCFVDNFGLADKYTSEEITYFASALGCPVKLHLELISSEQDMEKAYNMENYPNMRQNSDLSCTLHHSCMRYEDTARRAADFYHNFAGAKMLIAKGEDGLIYGRTIIWKNVEIEGMKTKVSLIERVYCCYDFIYALMMEWAAKNVDFRKKENTYNCTQGFVALRKINMSEDNCQVDKNEQLTLEMRINVPQLKWHKCGVPYMDTFHRICYCDGNLYIANYVVKPNSNFADCRNTSAFAERTNHICPVCGKVHCSSGLCGSCRDTYFTTNEYGSFYMNKKGFAVYKGKTVLREMLYKGKPNKNYQTVLNTDKLFQ